MEGSGRLELDSNPGRALLEGVPPDESELTTLAVVTGLLVVATEPPAPRALPRLGDKAISNCAASRSSVLETLLGLGLLTLAAAAEFGGGTDENNVVADELDDMEGEGI
jgi:hypothetical protein